MTSYTDKNRDLLVLLARRCPDFNPFEICQTVGRLRRQAARWKTATERYCNGTCDENWFDLTRDSVRAKAAEILTGTGLTVVLTGDPRGYTFKLVPQEGAAYFPSNTWGKDGWGVE